MHDLKHKRQKKIKLNVLVTNYLKYIEPTVLFNGQHFKSGHKQIFPVNKNVSTWANTLLDSLMESNLPRKGPTFVSKQINFLHPKNKHEKQLRSVVVQNEQSCILSKKLKSLPAAQLKSKSLTMAQQKGTSFRLCSNKAGCVTNTQAKKLCSLIKAFYKFAHGERSVQLNCTSNGPEISFTVSFDLKEATQNLVTSIGTEIIANTTDLVIKSKQEELQYIQANKRQFSNVHVKHNMKCKLSYNNTNWISDEALKFVANIFCFLNKLLTSCSSKDSVSLRFQNWHVRDITQGYCLKVLLKNKNITSLNVMRNLYFVIITTDTPNLILEINFNTKNDILIQEPTPVHGFCSSIIDWNEEHKKIIKNYVDKKFLESLFTSLRYTSFTSIPCNTKISDSYIVETEESSTTIFSPSEFVSSTVVSVKTVSINTRGITTSHSTTYYGLTEDPKLPTVDRAAGDDVVITSQDIDCKQFVAKPSQLKSKTYYKPEFCNETMFERLSFQSYIYSSPSIWSILLKSFGHILGCSIASFLISIL